MRDEDDWLYHLKAGDKVILSSISIGSKDTVATVERTTKTQIVLKGVYTKFRRDGGWQLGGSCRFLRVYTEEKGNAIKKEDLRKSLIHKCEELGTRNLSIDQLQRILTIIQEA